MVINHKVAIVTSLVSIHILVITSSVLIHTLVIASQEVDQLELGCTQVTTFEAKHQNQIHKQLRLDQLKQPTMLLIRPILITMPRFLLMLQLKPIASEKVTAFKPHLMTAFSEFQLIVVGEPSIVIKELNSIIDFINLIKTLIVWPLRLLCIVFHFTKLTLVEITRIEQHLKTQTRF